MLNKSKKTVRNHFMISKGLSFLHNSIHHKGFLIFTYFLMELNEKFAISKNVAISGVGFSFTIEHAG